MENVAHHEEDTHVHHPPPMTYHITFGLLVLGMILTIVASLFSLGGTMNNIIAMAIATAKATLVVLYFMQVKYNTKLTWIWAALGFIWLIFLFATMGDYLTRERSWLHVAGWH